MPAFYPQAMNGHLPLTPPYSASYDQQYHQDSYPPPPTSQPPRLDSAMDYTHRFPLPSATQQPTYHRGGYSAHQNLPPISSYYEPMGAPILPPLRMQDAYQADRDYYHHYQQTMSQQQAQQRPAQKEEQTTGGVSAKLDYDMERMTDFVSEAAQGIILQTNTPVHPSFRKWVSQVLSATRLPSATILLSLHYLTVRMREFPSTIEKTENQLYRLLCVSMILGSKFLDDNTFINRSWSDVSGIKVSELNNLEIRWLALIGFDLHADPEDSNGVSLWLRAWQEYDARQNKARATRLSPINTDVQRQKSFRSARSSYHGGYTKAMHGAFTPQSGGSVASNGNGPYSSADPWNRYDGQSDVWSTGQPFSSTEDYHHSRRYPAAMHSHTSNQPYSQYSLPPLQSVAPSFYTPWNQSAWGHSHGYGCHCVGCSRQSGSYLMGAHFAPQTVVG